MQEGEVLDPEIWSGTILIWSGTIGQRDAGHCCKCFARTGTNHQAGARTDVIISRIRKKLFARTRTNQRARSRNVRSCQKLWIYPNMIFKQRLVLICFPCRNDLDANISSSSEFRISPVSTAGLCKGSAASFAAKLVSHHTLLFQKITVAYFGKKLK